MKFEYYPNTDTLYIDLTEESSKGSEEVAENIVLDFDENGKICGIEIEHASELVDLKKVEIPLLEKTVIK